MNAPNRNRFAEACRAVAGRVRRQEIELGSGDLFLETGAPCCVLGHLARELGIAPTVDGEQPVYSALREAGLTSPAQVFGENDDCLAQVAAGMMTKDEAYANIADALLAAVDASEED